MPYSISKHTSCLFPLKGLANLSLQSSCSNPISSLAVSINSFASDFTEESNLVLFNIITYMIGFKCFLFVLSSWFYSFFFPCLLFKSHSIFPLYYTLFTLLLLTLEITTCILDSTGTTRHFNLIYCIFLSCTVVAM